uniref:Phosphoglycerate mutase n=1 Tax=Dunaliella tertiolecta TaxID=3047 RepID=A0A7S3QK30_DUNTE|mmetsp:Transcript_28693/g.77352  ORF Transcript_28693/g.77352 Transcript_28693/m.77352 type:complete len:224 (+) Transcript_28693:145-816(+)|eukprot:CAMPEP_0202353520 /NCGR_PEP_ID=MMETSP1126-20121109/9245_1 /ASSEMBLY_ACC=CAM_ASM_000457 /TAXON_ID=3047 /ORGANISM="Dunaliella tertiolecta, Strain CCMP1320" /LENGTH=223 /DNA_ID=CAMNT_0048945879 /DNA_START=106 /DNA_END=777 /DNA_ORIENTATION=-
MTVKIVEFPDKGMKNSYIFLRHGHSLANEQNIIVSSLEHGVKPEYGLSAKGVEEAKHAGLQFKLMLEKLPKAPVKFITSPFSRAIETATHIAHEVGIARDQIDLDDNLRERYFGQALELKPAHENYKHIHAEDESSKGTKGPGNDGESANAVAERVMKTIKTIEEVYDGHIIVLSSHGDTCTIGQMALRGADISTHFKHPLTNCELRHICEDHGHHSHHAEKM